MARPTDEKKDKTIKLRISAELYEELSKKGPNLSETIRKILKGEESEKKTAENSVPHNDYVSYVAEFDEMASCSGISLQEMMEGFNSLLENGKIMIENGEMRIEMGSWAGEFEAVCHDLCIPVEKAAEGAIKALKRGGF